MLEFSHGRGAFAAAARKLGRTADSIRSRYRRLTPEHLAALEAEIADRGIVCLYILKPFYGDAT
jgi:hypothetical protein